LIHFYKRKMKASKEFFLVTILIMQCACSGDELDDDEEGVVEEDLSKYTLSGDIYYKTTHKPRDCLGPMTDDDDVTMIMEYYGEQDGVHQNIEKAVSLKMNRGQSIRLNGHGLTGMCLGEKRSLIIPKEKIRRELMDLLPDISEISTYLEVELVSLNGQRWETLDQGLLLVMLEEIEDESCERVVVNGDILAVEYEGSLEDGTIFDSSAARQAPFGPFVMGRGQIIAGYEIALAGRCLGERFKMVVPPHLAYGDSGVGDSIPGGATLHFDVRLVKLNEAVWTPTRPKKVLRWETVRAVEDCVAMAGRDDTLFIHYLATREDGSEFGSKKETAAEPYGPFKLYTTGLSNVPGLNPAIEGMCLGESRKVFLPPRIGWAGQFETMEVVVDLVKVNNESADIAMPPKGPPKSEL